MQENLSKTALDVKVNTLGMGNNILKISKQETIHCKEMQFYMKDFFGKYERIGSKACI